MSEEVENTNDGTWSGLKKTIIAGLTTLITAGGAYVGSTLFGGSDKEETKTEQVAPAPASAPITINVQQSQENKQQQKSASPTIIRERVIEKPVPVKEEKKKEEPKEEEAPW